MNLSFTETKKDTAHPSKQTVFPSIDGFSSCQVQRVKVYFSCVTPSMEGTWQRHGLLPPKVLSSLHMVSVFNTFCNLHPDRSQRTFTLLQSTYPSFIQAKVSLLDIEDQNIISPNGQINSGSCVYTLGPQYVCPEALRLINVPVFIRKRPPTKGHLSS